MKHFFAVLALALFFAAPLATTVEANPDYDRGASSTTLSPPGEILD